ncbi:hypothetical protein F4778DRAFT_785439 [Xylariomycetidae sp. FL2044]|nr:hypothetical protein F4778DRAFT_785439 [Xylariomycetidae sp. FL2044]
MSVTPAYVNWWKHPGRDSVWRYPELPGKGQMIYRFFRLLYPEGAFINDDLKIVEAPEKYWFYVQGRLMKTVSDAEHGVKGFLDDSQPTEPEQKREAIGGYVIWLLHEVWRTFRLGIEYDELAGLEEFVVRCQNTCPALLRYHTDPLKYHTETKKLNRSSFLEGEKIFHTQYIELTISSPDNAEDQIKLPVECRAKSGADRVNKLHSWWKLENKRRIAEDFINGGGESGGT